MCNCRGTACFGQVKIVQDEASGFSFCLSMCAQNMRSHHNANLNSKSASSIYLLKWILETLRCSMQGISLGSRLLRLWSC